MKNIALLLVVAFFGFAHGRDVLATAETNARCMEFERQRNEKDLYPKEDNCHSYYQCFYSSNTEAIGLLHRCKHGYFFDKIVLGCVEEGPVECTRLHERSVDQGRISATSCRDTLGNTLHTVDNNPDLFRLGDKTFACPNNRPFDLDMCQCDMSNIEQPSVNMKRACQLWMPFEDDLHDHSFEKFLTYPSGDAEIDENNYFNGEGSLHLGHGQLRIQGMKAMDLLDIGVKKTASWCFGFRCNNGNSYDCLSSGGILSDSKDATLTDFTIVAAIRPNNLLEIHLNTKPVVTRVTTNINWKHAGWNQACVVLDHSKLRIYINSKIVSETEVTGTLKPGFQPYVVGSDRGFGNFIGHIDDVLVCAHPLGVEEIKNLYRGNYIALGNDGLIPPY